MMNLNIIILTKERISNLDVFLFFFYHNFQKITKTVFKGSSRVSY